MRRDNEKAFDLGSKAFLFVCSMFVCGMVVHCMLAGRSCRMFLLGAFVGHAMVGHLGGMPWNVAGTG
ncbi:hypothetical protein, partial [Pseudomonas sp. SIMBA_067]|uniref:hypothetical protein n=1 Tax=Pseudomonas sp. SIMBA_067 TaxID=3085807 RepID=UPI00397E5034